MDRRPNGGNKATFLNSSGRVKQKCKCHLFTHGAPAAHKNSFEMPVHSRIESEFGNVGF